MKKRKYLQSAIIVLAVLCAMAGCRPSGSVKERLDRAEACMNSDPELASRTIDSIDSRMLVTRSRRARYRLLKSMILDKNFIDTTDVSLIMPAVEYYRRHGTPTDKMRAYYYLGVVYSNAGNISKSLLSYMKADEESIMTDDYYTISLLKYSIANAFSLDYNTAEELKYIKDAYDYAVLAGDSIGVWYYIAALADSYNNNGKLDIADSLYESLMISRIRDTSFFVQQIRRYAKSLVLRENINPEKSIELFEKSSILSGNKRVDSKQGAYAYALEMAGYPSEADSVFSSISLQDDMEITDTYKYMICKHRGDFKGALFSLENAVDVQDSIVLRSLKQSFLALQKEYFKDKSLDEKKQKERESFKMKATLLFLLLIIVIFLIYVFITRLKEAERDVKILEWQKMINVKDATINQLQEQYFMALRDKFNIINSLCSDYFLPAQRNKKEIIYRNVERVVLKLRADAVSQKSLQAVINEKMDGFINRIRAAIPSHQEKDFAFISYLAIGLDAKTISLLMNIQVDTVYTKKARLKKEIEALESKEDKVFFLRCLSM